MDTLEKAAHSALLIGALFLLCCCTRAVVNSEAPTPTPSATPVETLVQVPGMTEPTATFPCQQGTWETLTFGKTTDEQVAQWVSTSELVHRPSFHDSWEEAIPEEFQPRTHAYMWNLLSQETPYGIMWLNVVSGTLSSLTAPVFYPLTLQEVVEQIGAPEFVWIYLDMRYEECAYDYELYYPTQGIVITGAIYDQSVCNKAAKKEVNLLETDWPVTDFTCSAPGTLQELIGARYNQLPEAAESVVGWSQPWNGFGWVYPAKP